MAKVELIEVQATIKKALDIYTLEVAKKIKESVPIIAQQMVAEIKAASPVLTGDYQKGWARKIAFESTHVLRMIAYNKTKPQLTAVLEFGHAKRNGGRVEGRPHIMPARDKAQKNLEDAIARAVDGVGIT